MALPKRERQPLIEPSAGRSPGAERMVRGLGPEAELFRTSLDGPESDAMAADRRIAQMTSPISLGDGGILDFGRRHPDDPMLALWSGLFLGAHGHPALAAGQLAKARGLGCPPARIDPHLKALAAWSTPSVA